MNELRKDSLLNRYVIISPKRIHRPGDITKREKEGKKGTCFFCPGNEHLTPPEIMRQEENGNWIIRVFPNKFPAVSFENPGNFENAARGVHEIIVETPEHVECIEHLSPEYMVKILDVYDERIRKLSEIEDISYVLVFKNKGREGGASLEHTHTQVIATTVLPTNVLEKVKALDDYRKKHNLCGYCDVIKKEESGERVIFEDEHVISMAPYASRFPYEALIMPKRHVLKLHQLNENEKHSIAKALKMILMKLGSDNISYNFWLHYAPGVNDLHLHFEITPRLTHWAGFEFGAGIIINVIPPEDAAKFYRGEV